MHIRGNVDLGNFVPLFYFSMCSMLTFYPKRYTTPLKRRGGHWESFWLFLIFLLKNYIYFIFSTIEWHKVIRTRKTLCHLNKYVNKKWREGKMVLLCIKTHSTGLKEHSGMWIAGLPWWESTESIKIQYLNFRAIKLLKVNPGTQIRVSPSLSRDTEHTHSLIDPPAQKGVNEFLEILIFVLKFQFFFKKL